MFKCCEGNTGAWQVGGGVDVPVAAGVSVGGDFGVVGPTGDGVVLERSGYALFGNGFLMSFSGAYHVNRRDARQPRPFLTAGIGEAFRHGDATGGFHVGAGIDCWLRERRGIRIEIRDQLLGEFGTSHVVTARAGLIFR